MRRNRQTSILILLTLLTFALAIGADVFLFPAEPIGAGTSAWLLNHVLNIGLWFMLLTAPVIVLYMFWHLAIDLIAIPQRSSQLRNR